MSLQLQLVDELSSCVELDFFNLDDGTTLANCMFDSIFDVPLRSKHNKLIIM